MTALQTRGRLAALPLEILSVIFGHLEGRDLKHVRRTCTVLSAVAAPSLFAEVVILTSTQIIMDALSFFRKSPHLAIYVQTLVFRGSFLDFFQNLSRLIETTDEGSLSDDDMRRLPRLPTEVRNQVWEIDPLEEVGIEIALLARLIGHLPSFRACNVLSGIAPFAPREPFAPIWPAAMVRRFGAGNLERIRQIVTDPHNLYSPDIKWSARSNKTHVPTVLLALVATTAQVKRFTATNLHIEYLFPPPEERLSGSRLYHSALRNVFASLLELDLNLVTEYHGVEWPLNSLSDLLASAPDLEVLKLGIHCNGLSQPWFPTEDESNHHEGGRSIFHCLSARAEPFRRLHTLSLSGVHAVDRSLLSFLKRHASTLHSLSLQNILLHKYIDGSAKRARACWVDTLKQVGQSLNLRHIKLSGFLANGGQQKWQVVAPNQADRTGLRGSIIEFILRGGACPHDLERFRIEEGEEDLVFDYGQPWRGDETWRLLEKDEQRPE